MNEVGQFSPQTQENLTSPRAIANVILQFLQTVSFQSMQCEKNLNKAIIFNKKVIKNRPWNFQNNIVIYSDGSVSPKDIADGVAEIFMNSYQLTDMFSQLPANMTHISSKNQLKEYISINSCTSSLDDNGYETLVRFYK